MVAHKAGLIDLPDFEILHKNCVLVRKFPQQGLKVVDS